MTRSRKRGFALVSSMAAVVLVLMLLGAFFAANRSYIALSRLDDDKKACRDAVLALSDYCRFRLEKERSWGKIAAAPPYTLKDKFDREVFSFKEVAPEDLDDYPGLVSLPGEFHVVGTMASNKVAFQLAFTNNLQGSGETGDGVQAKSCRLLISARRGSAEDVVEIGYRTAAFFDSTLAASKNISIDVGGGDLGHLELHSEDPVHNELRSLSNVNLPKAEDIEFRPDDANVAAVKGTIWARQEIAVDGDSSQNALDRAAAQTQGQFVANGRSQYDAPELTLEQARHIGDALDVEPMRNGVYYFRNSEVTFEAGGATQTKLIHTFQRFEPEVDSQGPLTDFHFLASDLPDGADLSTVRLAGEPGAESHSYPADDFKIPRGPKINFYQGGEFKPTASLEAGKKLVVSSEERPDGSKIPGDFKLKGADNIVPTVLLRGDTPDSRVCLNVEGSLVVEGVIEGGGRLIAGQDVALQANRVSVTADSEDDLAIYAGNNVSIYPGANAGTDGNGDAPGGGTLAFRGLVYAGNNFTFDSSYRKEHADGTVEWFQYDVNLRIRGAVVARNGIAKIRSKRGVKLIYDPSYLDNFLDDEYFGERLQVEELSWRPR